MSQDNRIQQEKTSILKAMLQFDEAKSLGEIEGFLLFSINKKTLQRRLKELYDDGQIVTVGEKRNTKYYANKDNSSSLRVLKSFDKDTIDNNIRTIRADEDNHPIFSKEAISQLAYLDTPSYARKKSSYQFDILDNYLPNITQYLPNQIQTTLAKMGKRFDDILAAGTYARNISQRLLIDLSYNSSRLEGNTYSKLDTQKLIEQGLTADGKVHEETIMIINHKEAIEFLIENAEEIIINPFTIRNIHALLSQDLLANSNAYGNIRQIEVSIGKSAYLPLNNPHQLEEYFSLLLRKAEQIHAPFEQSFFLFIHLSYLQAFEDVNKRTARLSCNIPFIKHNFCPLSFIDVPQEDYFKALLYFYETNELLPALELFKWAYTRSCEQYDVVKESIGEIDIYRIQHRVARKVAMGNIIRENLNEQLAEQYLEKYCAENDIPSADKFIAMTLSDLAQLHVGSIVGLGITEKMFIEWKK
ncbi:Fic family protein [Pectobacterium polaris]|uniref:Fic family protein n=1 Tax=Pectobacterium polaris TaxID=2042057 RepID=UPI001CF5055E|nr:Fic family protein [Pectobacterium polaris]MCA6952811.1 Fic family protein [Pectobacterium polaris]